MIQAVIAERGEARLKEIARRFGVSNVTAHKIIDRLKHQGLILEQSYRALRLTVKGRQLATWSRHRHAIVYHFLRVLGVPASVAKVDAEGIEHHVSPQTLRCFKRHSKRFLR